MNGAFEIPNEVLVESITPSPDATRVLYIVREKWGMHVAISSVKHRFYNAVAGLTFSPDSSIVAYAAARNEAWFVVFGEKEYGPYTDIGKTSPVISPDSKHVAYTAQIGRDRWIAVLDDTVIGGPYEGFSPGGLLFSPDSKRIAYAIKNGSQWSVIDSGKELGSYHSLLGRSLTFSPNSSRLAYIALVEKRGFLGQSKTNAMLVVDGTTGPAWHLDERSNQNRIMDEIVFSPDSQKIAYAVCQDARWTWLVDDVLQPRVDAFVSGWGGDPQWKLFPDYGKMCCYRKTLTFSPDSKHFAYAGQDGGQHILIYDGKPRGRHSGILNWPLVFSHDSDHFAYSVEENGEQFIVLDWKPLNRHYGISCDRCFSPDSSKFAYIAMKTPKSFQLVIGPRSWQMPGSPLLGARLVWDDSDNMHTLVLENRSIIPVAYHVR